MIIIINTLFKRVAYLTYLKIILLDHAWFNIALISVTAPCSGVLLENPRVAELLKNIPQFYGIRKFIILSTRVCHCHWSLS
jgi:hypothetical protein